MCNTRSYAPCCVLLSLPALWYCCRAGCMWGAVLVWRAVLVAWYRCTCAWPTAHIHMCPYVSATQCYMAVRFNSVLCAARVRAAWYPKAAAAATYVACWPALADPAISCGNEWCIARCCGVACAEAGRTCQVRVGCGCCVQGNIRLASMYRMAVSMSGDGVAPSTGGCVSVCSSCKAVQPW